ncbi:FtsX-like permease family protein [Niallia sp. BSM11]|uniref:FtsX-like permease family protein n=1 Tax=Niallia sp. BSM11 TaxID=3391576 RepID=UPI0039850FB2
MTFPQFAYKNITRNLRSYLAFYLSSSFAVMIFFMFAMFIFHPALEKGYMNSIAKKGMVFAEWVIFGFSIFFILYSASAFLKTRKKEFGILSIQGGSPKQLRLLITCENIFIGMVSILTGILGGTVLAKMFFTAGTYIVEMEALPLYLPWKAFVLTFGVFLLLFTFISQFTLFIIRSENTISLLKGTEKPKKELKPSLILSLLGVLFLGTGYGMALIAKTDMMTGAIILILTVIGTYLFYSQLSVWILKLLKRNKKFYRKGTNLLWISDLMYHVRDNARLFFIVSIVSAVAFTSTGTLATMKSIIPKQVSPFEMELISYPTNKDEKNQLDFIQNQFNEKSINYSQQKVEGIDIYQYENIQKETFYRLLVISQKDASSFFPGFEKVNLEKGEGIYYGSYAGNQEQFQRNKSSIKLLDQNMSIVLQSIERPISSLAQILVINEESYDHLKQSSDTLSIYGFQIPNWKDTLDMSQAIDSYIVGETYNPNAEYTSRAIDYYANVQIPSLSLFIGLFIAIIFVLAAGSFLYFRLYTDLYEDRKKYKSLAKIGLSEKEMVRNASLQIGILFFLPFLLAVIDTAFALHVLQREGGFPKILHNGVITILGFFGLQLLYFLAIRSSYIKNLKEYVYR